MFLNLWDFSKLQIVAGFSHVFDPQRLGQFEAFVPWTQSIFPAKFEAEKI